MSVQTRIEEKLAEALAPAQLEVVNESHRHNVPPGSESHFRVTIVAESFDGQALLARHRQVNRVLADELAGPVHALALHTFTPMEWKQQGGTRESPPCLGGEQRSP